MGTFNHLDGYTEDYTIQPPLINKVSINSAGLKKQYGDIPIFIDGNELKVPPGGYQFNINDKVRKVSGYKFPGVVVSRFVTLAGKERYVVECTAEDVAGILHVYNKNQLEKVNEKD